MESTIWQLRWGRYLPSHPQDQILGIIITPVPVKKDIVEAAWSHAVRYTARGLDLPDFEAAIALILQRHPSWEFRGEFPIGHVAFNPQTADKDTPDT